MHIFKWTWQIALIFSYILVLHVLTCGTETNALHHQLFYVTWKTGDAPAPEDGLAQQRSDRLQLPESDKAPPSLFWKYRGDIRRGVTVLAIMYVMKSAAVDNVHAFHGQTHMLLCKILLHACHIYLKVIIMKSVWTAPHVVCGLTMQMRIKYILYNIKLMEVMI